MKMILLFGCFFNAVISFHLYCVGYMGSRLKVHSSACPDLNYCQMILLYYLQHERICRLANYLFWHHLKLCGGSSCPRWRWVWHDSDWTLTQFLAGLSQMDLDWTSKNPISSFSWKAVQISNGKELFYIQVTTFQWFSVGWLLFVN